MAGSLREATGPSAGTADARSGRDPVLDLLKAVGLLGIVIAHTNPPPWLYQVRSFGLGVMAFVSGAVLVESRNRQTMSTAAYLRRRLKQLFVPTWVFLTVGGALLMVLSTLVGNGWAYSPDRLLRAFLLLDGGAFNTQVVRVFLLLSLSAPVWLALRRRTESLGLGLLAIAGVWIGYELLCWPWSIHRWDVHWLTTIAVQDVLLDTIGYGLCFALGTHYRQLARKHLLGLAALLGAGLVVFFELRHGGWTVTHRWKWPPRFPYLAYAGISGLLMSAAFQASDGWKRLGRSAVIRNASGASLWFFFWHSFVLQLWNILVDREDFLLELPVNLVGAYALLALQQHLVRAWLARDLSETARRRISTVFAIR